MYLNTVDLDYWSIHKIVALCNITLPICRAEYFPPHISPSPPRLIVYVTAISTTAFRCSFCCYRRCCVFCLGSTCLSLYFAASRHNTLGARFGTGLPDRLREISFVWFSKPRITALSSSERRRERRYLWAFDGYVPSSTQFPQTYSD